MGDECKHPNHGNPDHDCGPFMPTADLPDAVVEAAAEVIYRNSYFLEWETEDRGEACYFKKWEEVQHKEPWFAKARAVLAAASGPWAEHLDAARAEADELFQRLHGSRAELDAALARNAELKRIGPRVEIEQRFDGRTTCKVYRDGVALFHGIDPQAETVVTALRAELDNLRDRVTALADKWQDSEFRRKQPVLAYVGLDVAARDLAADREAFDREVARKGAEVGRMNAAIVRGSDDEAGEDV